VAKSFAERWHNKEVACGEESGMSFVSCFDAVLPVEGAGFLFYPNYTQVPLWKVSGDWPTAEIQRLAPYWVIGWVEGVGDAVCTDQRTGSVWLLYHWDRFQSRAFVNSSVGQLAECLLAQLGEVDPDRFRAAVQAIDPAALAEKSLWSEHAAGLAPDTQRV
jgi:SUKH-4 immunity protein